MPNIFTLPMRSPFLTRTGILVLTLAVAPLVMAQIGHAHHVDTIYAEFENQTIADPSVALSLLSVPLKHYRSTGDFCRVARIESWRCNCFEKMGVLDSAMVCAQRGLGIFNGDCDSLILMSLNVNLSNVLLGLGEFDKVLDLCEVSLRMWNIKWPYSIAHNGLYTNRAIALANLGKLDQSLSAFEDCLSNASREGVPSNEVDALTNIGAIYGLLSEGGKRTALVDSAVHYTNLAIAVAKRAGYENTQVVLYNNLANTFRDKGHHEIALAYLDSASTIALESKDLPMLTRAAELRHTVYFDMGRLDSAYAELRHFVILKDSLLNIEKVKAIADVQEKYESEKKAKEILGLKAENLEGELEQAQVKRTRNIFFFSAIGVVGLAIGLWSRLRFVHRSRAAIQKEKDISEGLLLNILPEEVAEELKAKGYADVKEFDTATILFSDFKGFTQMSEKLPATELVAEIDHCFKAFDGIMGKYHIEKIKTIGDAYMAAGGLPDPANGQPLDVVLAAIEMQAFMATYKAERAAAGRIYFEMRVGIHTGPVIAGIVGVKKFAYDIWGDTVNTASRMESSGEVGRVNISESTYALVNGAPELRFTARGKVQAKGKGEMEMYFAELV